MKKTKKLLSLVLIVAMLSSLVLSGCDSKDTGKIEIELLQDKPEALAAFEKIEEEFNKTHDNIHLTIQSPNEAMTILKTRFIRDDYPDIIGIGGDINYSNFLDADLFMERLARHQAEPLCRLTNGVHLHTLRCPNGETFQRITAALREQGILFEKEEEER